MSGQRWSCPSAVAPSSARCPGGPSPRGVNFSSHGRRFASYTAHHNDLYGRSFRHSVTGACRIAPRMYGACRGSRLCQEASRGERHSLTSSVLDRLAGSASPCARLSHWTGPSHYALLGIGDVTVWLTRAALLRCIFGNLAHLKSEGQRSPRCVWETRVFLASFGRFYKNMPATSPRQHGYFLLCRLEERIHGNSLPSATASGDWRSVRSRIPSTTGCGIV
jgi:hypothetical protein